MAYAVRIVWSDGSETGKVLRTLEEALKYARETIHSKPIHTLKHVKIEKLPPITP